MRGVNIAHIKCLVGNFGDFKLPRGIFSVDVDEKPSYELEFLSYCTKSIESSVCKYSAIFLKKNNKQKLRSFVIYSYLNDAVQQTNKCSQHDAISEGDTGQLTERLMNMLYLLPSSG